MVFTLADRADGEPLQDYGFLVAANLFPFNQESKGAYLAGVVVRIFVCYLTHKIKVDASRDKHGANPLTGLAVAAIHHKLNGVYGSRTR